MTFFSERYRSIINSLTILLIITVVSHLFRDSLDIINIGFLHMIPVVIISIYGNAKITFVITFISVICFNFLYIPPLYSFTVHNELYVWSFIIFGLIAYIVTFQAKTLNNQRRENELRESILHIISHDLRTPLSTIHGSVNLILNNQTMKKEQVSALLEDIFYASLRMKRLITNLFDSARLSSGKMVLKQEWCDFEDILGVALEEFPHKNNEELLEVKLTNLQLFWGDNILLIQLLVNLLDNAFKYSLAESKIVLHITMNPHSVLIEITNQTDALTLSKLNAIFDKFYRIEQANDISGSGIGLAICKSIVHLHGGHIEARHAQGSITIATTLPIRKKMELI